MPVKWWNDRDNSEELTGPSCRELSLVNGSATRRSHKSNQTACGR